MLHCARKKGLYSHTHTHTAMSTAQYIIGVLEGKRIPFSPFNISSMTKIFFIYHHDLKKTKMTVLLYNNGNW